MDINTALNTSLDELSLADKVAAHALLRAVVEASEARVSALKEDLSIIVEAKGEKTDTGTVNLVIAGSKVALMFPQAKLPEMEGFLSLLKGKGIDPSEGTDVVQTLKVNEGKLAFLVQSGKVSQAEVDALRPRNKSLRVYASSALKALLAPFKAKAGKTVETVQTLAA